MSSLIKNIIRCQSGHSAITISASMPIVIGALGMGIDLSMDYFAQQRMQNAADQAAMSAARAYIAQKASDLHKEANYIAEQFSFSKANGATITVNRPPASGPNAGSSSHLEVIITQPQPRYFSSIFGEKPVPVTARAVASFSKGQSTCILALEGTASKAVNVSGGAVINLESCDMQVNSTSTSALTASGGALVSGDNVMVVGNASLSGGAAVETTGNFQKGAPKIDDPFATFAIPTAGSCAKTGYKTSSPATLDPGTYCGGVTVSSGGDVFLNPGLYIMDHGKLTVSGGGRLVGHDVTIVFTSSTGTNYGGTVFSGSSIVELSAPKTGATAGMVIVGARTMTLNTKFDFSGGSNQLIDGTIYVPRAFLNWSGDSNLNVYCLNIISNTVQFSGSAALAAVDCDKYGTYFGAASVVLTE